MMAINIIKVLHIVVPLILFFVSFQNSMVHGRSLLSIPIPNRPDPKDVPATARWLVSQSSWGVLSTISIDSAGAPWGNVASFSDGLPNQGTGIPYFYLTSFDPTVKNALKDQRVSFTVSEYPLGTCGKMDPYNPKCSKITLTGKLTLLEEKSKEAEFGRKALFTKHPEMKGWPKDHNFQVYALGPESIFFIDDFGGPKPLSVEEYLHWKGH